MDEELPRRWLLVSREVGVPLQEEGAGQMSLDHLFLDQGAVPTLVEVKRGSDTRIRREVVGQMLIMPLTPSSIGRRRRSAPGSSRAARSRTQTHLTVRLVQWALGAQDPGFFQGQADGSCFGHLG
jgi:hypothetical protein